MLVGLPRRGPRLPPPRRPVPTPRDGQCHLPPPPEAARRPELTLKDLRHTWATLALEQGIQPLVQERLGHSTIAVTLGIYSHVAPTLHDEAAGIVAHWC